MISSIQATIRALAAPKHGLSCPSSLWREGLSELKRRGEGHHESGAFLLGHHTSNRRAIQSFVYYDDLDPHSLDTGIVMIDGITFGKLWQYCRNTRLSVVADIHTHPGQAWQSPTDRKNPMVGTPGHIAIIVPNFAERFVKPSELGIYEYQGQHSWKEHLGMAANEFFYVGIWG